MDTISLFLHPQRVEWSKWDNFFSFLFAFHDLHALSDGLTAGESATYMLSHQAGGERVVDAAGVACVRSLALSLVCN